MPIATVSRTAAVAMLCFLSLLLAVFGAFLVPHDVVPGVSTGVALAVVGSYLIARRARVVASPPVASLPALVWLGTVVTLGAGRAEGDVVLTGSWASLAFVVLGALAAAVGLGRPPAVRRADATQDDADETDPPADPSDLD